MDLCQMWLIIVLRALVIRWRTTIYGADCINAVPSYFDYDLYDPSPTEWQTVVTPVEYGISSQCMDY